MRYRVPPTSLAPSRRNHLGDRARAGCRLFEHLPGVPLCPDAQVLAVDSVALHQASDVAVPLRARLPPQPLDCFTDAVRARRSRGELLERVCAAHASEPRTLANASAAR